MPRILKMVLFGMQENTIPIWIENDHGYKEYPKIRLIVSHVWSSLEASAHIDNETVQIFIIYCKRLHETMSPLILPFNLRHIWCQILMQIYNCYIRLNYSGCQFIFTALIEKTTNNIKKILKVACLFFIMCSNCGHTHYLFIFLHFTKHNEKGGRGDKDCCDWVRGEASIWFMFHIHKLFYCFITTEIIWCKIILMGIKLM